MITKRKRRMSENSKEKFSCKTNNEREKEEEGKERDGCNFIIED